MIALLLLACVIVDHDVFDPERSCWEDATTARPLTWWHGYGKHRSGCNEVSWSAVDGDGTCLSFRDRCNEEAHDDPHLSDCDEFPECCEPEVTNAPQCP